MSLLLWLAVFVPVAGDLPAQQAPTHLAHITTGFADAPEGRGLAVTAAREANTAMLYANFAAGHPTDLEAMKANTRNVLHALNPAQGGPGSGPGLGYGLRRAAEAVSAHIRMALEPESPSAALREIGPGVASAADGLVVRIDHISALASQLIAAGSAAEAAAIAAEIRAVALQLDTGADLNGNGRIEVSAGEAGINQLEAQLYSILEAERLPRVLR